MEEINLPWGQVLTLLGIVFGPIITYFLAKRMTEAKVRLIDIDAIKGWSEQRRSWEAEIAQLHNELDEERTRRQEDRVQYEIDLEKLKANIKELRASLLISEETTKKYKFLLETEKRRYNEAKDFHIRIDKIQNQLSEIILGGREFNETLKEEVVGIRDNVIALRKDVNGGCE